MKTTRPKPAYQQPIPLRHSFLKGCHYENMKGSYEVLSVEGATLRIRWENGEETDTDVKLQDRILSRIERELRAAKAGRRGQKEPTESFFGERFRGLAPAEFGLEVPKTTWRSRTGGLGGAVTQELDAGDLCFGFWAPFLRPMIHWADIDQKNRRAAQLQAGFFCRLDEASAHYGFFVERSKEADGKGDWHRLLEWLGAPENDEWLRALAEKNELKISDPQEAGSFTGHLEASGAKWVWVDGERRTEVPGLGAFLGSLPDEPRPVIECATRMAKDRAVARALKIGRDIADVFDLLMPLYRASVGAAASKQASPPRRRAAK